MRFLVSEVPLYGTAALFWDSRDHETQVGNYPTGEGVFVYRGTSLTGCSRFRVRRGRVKGSGFGVQGFGFRVPIFGLWVSDSGLRVQGSGFRVQGARLRVEG